MSAAAAQTQVNVVAFAPGFAWANLFGASGTEKTEELLAFEKKEGITVNMEYADEETARQKVLLDLVNGTGQYDLVCSAAMAPSRPTATRATWNRSTGTSTRQRTILM